MSKYTPITLGLSPNTEEDDVALAEELIKDKSKWLEGPDISKLENAFKKKLGVEHAFAFKNGRSALQSAIESLTLDRFDEVLIQSFTCVAVPNAIIWGRAKPIYVDIDNSFNISVADIEKKITPKTRAIIVQHTFGEPADMEKIIKLAKEHKIAIIEDCAHALGATYKGKPVGTLGDIGIFSFGRDKVISSVFGGMTVTNDNTIANEFENILNASTAPRDKWIKKQLFHPILLNRYVLPNYTKLNIGKYILFIAVKLGLISKSVCAEEKEAEKMDDISVKMPNALATLALNQLGKLDKFNKHRREIAELYTSEIEKLKLSIELPIELPKENNDSENIYLRYSIKIKNPSKIIKAGRKRGILLDNWYNPAIAPAGVDNSKIFYDPKTCPNAEHISKLVLNLPTNINTSKKDAMRVVTFIKNIHKN